jgi:hypothetical protein
MNHTISSVDWDIEEDNTSQKESEIKITTENNVKETKNDIDFPIFKPFELTQNSYKYIIDELNNQGISLGDCLIIPNKEKFLSFLENIRDNITDIIKEFISFNDRVDPNKQKIQRRQGIAIADSDNKNAVDKEFFLNIPFNSVDSKGLIHFGNSNVYISDKRRNVNSMITPQKYFLI